MTRAKWPNDLKLSDSGLGAGAVSTAAQGEGAGCAGASWRAAQPVTEPVGPKPPPLIETDMPAVRCSAWLAVISLCDRLSAKAPKWLHSEVIFRASGAENLADRKSIVLRIDKIRRNLPTL